MYDGILASGDHNYDPAVDYDPAVLLAYRAEITKAIAKKMKAHMKECFNVDAILRNGEIFYIIGENKIMILKDPDHEEDSDDEDNDTKPDATKEILIGPGIFEGPENIYKRVSGWGSSVDA